MRLLDPTVASSLGLLLTSVFAPSIGQAQAVQTPQKPAQQRGYLSASSQPETPGQPQQPAYPQPGYPQAYPQPGYPSPVAPPTGYYVPPPYAAPAGYESPQSYDVPPAYPPYRRGVVFMPYLGLNSVVGSGSDAYSAGLHLGGLLGGHISSYFSLNGEMALDILRPKAGLSSADGHPVYFDFDLSPLFHFGIPRVEFVLGPKLGFFYYSARDYYGTWGSGVAYGVTAGVFFPVGSVALGGLFNFTGHSLSRSSCDPSPSEFVCPSVPSDFKFATISVALVI